MPRDLTAEEIEAILLEAADEFSRPSEQRYGGETLDEYLQHTHTAAPPWWWQRAAMPWTGGEGEG